MKATHDDLYDLIRLVRPLYKALESAVVRGLEGTGLGVTGRAVLEQIHDHGPLPVPAVARNLILPRQFVQKTVDALAADGLVERRANPAHRRSALIALTPDGDASIRRVLSAEAQVTRTVAERLAAGEIEIARRVMRTMIEGYAGGAEDGRN